ncbi:hypothetical protein M3J09_002088 [Ascochyta lentis]
MRAERSGFECVPLKGKTGEGLRRCVCLLDPRGRSTCPRK